jgi:hypothetical protein
MTFPTLLQFIRYNNWLLFVGPFLLLWTIWRFRQLRGQYKSIPKATMVRLIIEAVVAILLTPFAFILFLNFFRWQIIFHTEVVQEIRIHCLQSEVSPMPIPGSSVTFQDSTEVTNGLQQLAGALSYRRNHQTFSQGYVLQFRFQGYDSFSNVYLTAYSTDQTGQVTPIIVPHFGAGSFGPLNELGIYESAVFLDWLAQVIAPQMDQPCQIGAEP